MNTAIAAFWRVVGWPFKVVSYILIQGYRFTFSAFMGSSCRHAPSCSEFTRDAIWRHGFWPGGWMGLARIIRCRPGGTHGYDPVPTDIPSDAHWYVPWRYGRWR